MQENMRARLRESRVPRNLAHIIFCILVEKEGRIDFRDKEGESGVHVRDGNSNTHDDILRVYSEARL